METKDKKTGFAISEKYPGHPKSLTQRDKWTLQRIIRDNQFSPLGDITNRLNSSLDTTLHNNTVKKYLHDEGLGSYVSLKFGGSSVMFWGCFEWNRVGPLVIVKGNMDSDTYINILANHFIPWMTTHNIPILDWMAQSPNLNLIENLWNHLDRQVRKRKPLPKCKQELINVIQEKWRKISIEMVHGLISSLPNHVNAVIKAKGGNTKY
ncbi:hypothetical protein C1646_765195 [Rhizophagus diaphanus]|nr:hypothetical protein C1646_765195 [Rhizophagus diaphanus] [Rhizophagus sp. MUCL 43196]